MPTFTTPIHESNDCHEPAGSSAGGQFCSTTHESQYRSLLNKLDFDADPRLSDVLDAMSYNDAVNDADVEAMLAHFNARKVTFDSGDVVHVAKEGREQYVIEDDLRVTEAVEWVSRINDPSDYYPDYEDDQNRDFWASTPDLWHATTEDHVDSIREEGLRAENQTRGISNRSTGAAVFTADDPEALAMGSYGDVLIRINTAAMKADGRTPYTSREPDVVDAELRGAIAHRLGLRDYEPEIEQGMDTTTVIVHGSIPAKYLDIELPK